MSEGQGLGFGSVPLETGGFDGNVSALFLGETAGVDLGDAGLLALVNLVANILLTFGGWNFSGVLDSFVGVESFFAGVLVRIVLFIGFELRRMICGGMVASYWGQSS